MFRVTVHDEPQVITFEVEGRLSGPWVQEFEGCCSRALAAQRNRTLRVDLTGVTLIDAAGKAYLAALHRKGADFIAADCLTKSIVAEVTGAPVPEHGCPERAAKRSS
jgi:ABC-type transporter Mla MlaB component